MSGYIGTQPVPQATQTRDSFTATSGQTSFATGGYTPNYLDVYLNGVKLAAADYTASNGSDVVLASGASTGDILEVVAFTTFSPANIPSGTPSIDDNGNATAITIDSNESVMVGTTNDNPAGANVTGHALGPSGYISSSRDGGFVVSLNRKTSDGDIAVFRKDGATVGSIGAKASRMFLYSPHGSGTGIRLGDNWVQPSTSTGTNNDAVTNLGFASSRFKDLYLSGGAYLGGTAAANHLDDYEEGTFTAGVAIGTIGGGDGVYVKIGDLVFCSFTAGNFSNYSSGNPIQFTGLPFSSNSTNHGSHGSVFCRYTDKFPSAVQVNSGVASCRMWRSNSTSYDTVNHNNLTNGGYAYFFVNVTYRAS
jgi:hypothetical protein